jgi:pyridoxamine 5'-phosphate oxidase family protein
MATSQKFRVVSRNGRAAFVVDDIVSKDPWRVRCVEIRGTAEALQGTGADGDDPVIRIHPQRIISFGVDEPDVDPHLLTASNRNVG